MYILLEQLDYLCQLSKAAGSEIMSVYKDKTEIWQKEDQSPLTVADLRADKVIRQGLESYFPDIFILSEESQPLDANVIADTFFLVDPLDGTKEFLKRNDEFTVNIALVYRGKVIAGVVYAPALNELFYAAEGLGAYKETVDGKKRLLQVAKLANHQPMRVIGSRSHGGDQFNEWLEKLEDPYVLTSVGSSLKFCRVAEGAADIYPRLGLTSQWDTAAGQCILEQAGGKVLQLNSKSPLTYFLGLQSNLNPFFLAIGGSYE